MQYPKWILANTSCSFLFRTFRVQKEFVCASRHLWGLFLQHWCTFNNKSSSFSKTTFISMAHLLAVFTNTVRVWYSSGRLEELFNKKNTTVRTQKMSFQAHSPLQYLAEKAGHKFIKKKKKQNLNNIRGYKMAGFKFRLHKFGPRPWWYR